MSKEEYEHGMRDSNRVTITSHIIEHSPGLHIAHFLRLFFHTYVLLVDWVGLWMQNILANNGLGPLNDIISKLSYVNHSFLLMTLCQFNTLNH